MVSRNFQNFFQLSLVNSIQVNSPIIQVKEFKYKNDTKSVVVLCARKMLGVKIVESEMKYIFEHKFNSDQYSVDCGGSNDLGNKSDYLYSLSLNGQLCLFQNETKIFQARVRKQLEILIRTWKHQNHLETHRRHPDCYVSNLTVYHLCFQLNLNPFPSGHSKYAFTFAFGIFAEARFNIYPTKAIHSVKFSSKYFGNHGRITENEIRCTGF